MQISRDDPAPFNLLLLGRTPFHLDWVALVDRDDELRRAEHRARIRLNLTAANSDSSVGDPFGVGQSSRWSFGAEVDQLDEAPWLHIGNSSKRL